jgi:hypothetical protein
MLCHFLTRIINELCVRCGQLPCKLRIAASRRLAGVDLNARGMSTEDYPLAARGFEIQKPDAILRHAAAALVWSPRNRNRKAYDAAASASATRRMGMMQS